MPKVSPTTAPDFTDDERKWIDQHPTWRVVFMLIRLALVPALIAGITAYFERKSSHNDEKTEAAYKKVAPVVDTTQQQVEALTKQVDLLQKLVIAMAANGGAKPAEPAAGTIGLGNIGTLGHGAGGGAGAGYGSGAGGVRAPAAPAEVDPRLRPLVDLQTAARERKDVVALNCLTDKLRQAKQALRAHNFLVVASLTKEGRQCVGQEAAAVPTKAALVEELQHTKAPAFQAKPLPKSANDALQQMAK